MIGAGEDTVFVVNDGEHLFSGRIMVTESLGLYHFASLFSHLREQFRKNGHKLLQFLIGNRATRVAFDTTAAPTGIEVAAELFLEYIERD